MHNNFFHVSLHIFQNQIKTIHLNSDVKMLFDNGLLTYQKCLNLMLKASVEKAQQHTSVF